jgi:transcriptional regulator with XRE-family HTH domain
MIETNREFIKMLREQQPKTAKETFLNDTIEMLDEIAEGYGVEYEYIFHFAGNELSNYDQNVVEFLDWLPPFKNDRVDEIVDYLLEQYKKPRNLEFLPKQLLENLYKSIK